MLSRLYVDNFRCLENFELDLDETNVFLGRNGTGKTSVLNVLRNIQSLVVRGSKVDTVFPARDISLYDQRNEQRFEIETRVDGEAYRAGTDGRWFFRDGDGPVRVSKELKDPVDGLSLSEIIARRWE